MERINMKKYGFERTPERDFSDDGNKFTCFKMGRVRVSKLVSDGEAYISGNIYEGILNYDEYSKLSHYKDMEALNGVSVSDLTEADLIKFAGDCKAYDAEYSMAETMIQIPTDAEVLAKLNEDKAAYKRMYGEIKLKCIENFETIFINNASYFRSSICDTMETLLKYANRDPNKQLAGMSDSRKRSILNSTVADYLYESAIITINKLIEKNS